MVRRTLLLLTLALATATPALAHEHVTVGDGQYELTVGWRDEPPYVGQPNGLDLKVARVGASHGDDHEMHGEGHGGLFESEALHHGDTFSFTFTHEHQALGEILYHDHVSGESAHVTVSDDGPEGATAAVTLTDAGFEPASLTVRPGTTVTWTNERETEALIASGQHPGGDDHDHAHDEEDVVLDAHENLTITYEYGGKTFQPLDFRPAFGRPGWYTAEITPTRPGVYTVHIQGTIEGTPVDVRVEPHEVNALDETSFPEVDPAYWELARRVAALEQEIQTQIDNPPPVEDVDPTPAAGLLGVVAGAFIAVALLRRR